MKLRKLFAWLMTLVMLLGMVPTSHAELAGCNHDWDSGKWLRGEPSNCQDWKPKTYTCTICGATATNEECGPCQPGSKTWIRPQGSNCQEYGVWEITCKYCGEWLEGREEPGPHKWRETIVEEPWCDVGGMKAMICSVCGEWQNNGTPLNPLGHNWGSWRWAHGSAPSCTEGAWQVRECQRCGRMEDRYVEAGSHKFGEWITTEEPTCTERGRHHHKCTVCGYSEWEPIPTVDHIWGDWRVIEEPQVGIPGTERRACTFGCGLHEDREIPPLEPAIALEGLELTLTLDSTPANGKFFVLGEEIVLTVNWANNSDQYLHPCWVSIWPYEQPTMDSMPLSWARSWDSEETGPVAPGDGGTFSYIGNVTEEYIANGGLHAMAVIISSVYNGPEVEDVMTPFVTAPCGVEEDVNEEPVSADGLELTLVLSSTPANGEYFVVGEEVVFTENWVNNSDKTLYPFSVSIFTCAAPEYGSEVDQIGSWFAEDAGGPVAPGATGSHTLTVTVTEADVARGAIYAMAELLSTVHNGPDLENVATPYVTAPCAPVAGSDYATSIKVEVLDIPSVTAEWAGDVYTAKVKVTNTGDTTVSLYSHRFSDSNNEHYPNAIKYDWNEYQDDPRADWLPAGESLTTDIEFAVTQDGIKAGELRFNFTQFANPWYVVVNDVETNIPADIVAEPEGATGYYGKRDEEVTDTVEIVVPINQGSAEFDPEGLTVTKTASAGDYSNPCKPGDEVTFTITVTNNTGVELLDVEITDPIKGGNEDAVLDRIASMQPGESVTASFNYTVTEEDATVGVEGFENTAYASGHTADGTQVSGKSETIFVWCVIEHELTFFKSIANVPANGVFFVPGETIVFNISMFNHTPYPLYNIILTDPLCQDQYIYDAVNDMSYLYFGELYNEGNAMGESTSATVTVSYVVTEADAEAGSVTNTAEVTYQTWYGKEITDSDGATAPCGSAAVVNGDGVRLEKELRNAPANGEYYVPGEVLNYALTLRIDDGLLLDDAAIYDPINGGDGLVISYGKGLYGGMGNDVFYVVTEEDAQRGYVDNTAYATWIYQDSGEAGRCESETVIAVCGMGDLPENYEPTGILQVETFETTTPVNGTHYVEGETVILADVFTNRSANMTLTGSDWVNVEILGKGIFNRNDNFGADAVLAPGESKILLYSTYVITAEDVAQGYIQKTVHAGFVGDNDMFYTGSFEIRIPCGEGELPDDYVPPVDDDIDEDGIPNEEDPDVDGDGIPNGEDDDIDGDGIPNGEDDDIDGDGIPNDEDSEPFGPDSDGASAPVVVTKAVANTPANGEYFVVGETIEFTITVTNNSGNELAGMIITDPLDVDWIREINEVLLPGESRTEIFSYVVTELDAAVGCVENYANVRIIEADGYRFLASNVAVAPCSPSGADGDMEYPVYSGYVTEKPFGVITDLEVTKEVESLPLNGLYYTEGETIAYRITYVNIGETPLTDVMIYDSLAGMTEIASAENLAVNESRWCTFNYTVTAEDVARGYVSNTAIGQFEIDGYLHVVASETVIVDTDGQPDPEISEGILPPGGFIDVSKLNSDQYCRRVTSSRTNVSYSWGTSFCSDHANIQGSILMMEQAATTPEMQLQTANYAVALWRDEADKLYEELLGTADPQARAVIMAEYVSFLTHASNYETLLNALYPDQPLVVAQKMAGLWEEKCITLCQEMHMPVAARQDSFLAVEIATMEGISDSCTCVTYDEGKGWNNFEQNYCPAHSFPFVMIDMLLAGQDTAEAWTTVRQIWNVELRTAYNKLTAALGENSDVALAEYATLENWMIAREAELTLLYPDNPELVAQTMVRIVIDQVNALCQLAQ